MLSATLLIHCDLAILADVLTIRDQESDMAISTTIDLAQTRIDYDRLWQLNIEGKHVLQIAEALLFWAHFTALEISCRSKHAHQR